MATKSEQGAYLYRMKEACQVARMKKAKFNEAVVTAQGALESSWGTSELAKKANNLFGIKRTLGWESYLIIAWRFTRFPLTEAHAMAIYKQNNQYYLVNYRNVIPMASLKDKVAIKKAGFNYIGGIWRMPNGKRV